MPIPRFRPAKEFVNAIACPCLVASMKNSKLGNVSSGYRRKYTRDWCCRISVRLNAEEPGPWARDMLEFLFSQGGAAVALEEGMKEYESGRGFPGYDRLNAKTYREVIEHGVVPYITVSEIVLDEMTHNVLIVGSTQWDGNLEEHGLCVYLEEGRWRFGYAERFWEFISSLQAGMGTRPSPEPSVTKRAGQETATDVASLYGVWEFDKKEARKVMRGKRLAPAYCKMYLGVGEGVRYTFSPTRLHITCTHPFKTVDDYVVDKYAALGDVVKVHYREEDEKVVRVRSFRHWKNFLVDEEEHWLVLRRVGDGPSDNLGTCRTLP